MRTTKLPDLGSLRDEVSQAFPNIRATAGGSGMFDRPLPEAPAVDRFAALLAGYVSDAIEKRNAAVDQLLAYILLNDCVEGVLVETETEVDFTDLNAVIRERVSLSAEVPSRTIQYRTVPKGALA